VNDYQEIICGYRMTPTPVSGDIECNSAIDKISRQHSASRLPQQSPLLALLVSLWILNFISLILVVYAKHDVFTD